MEYVGYSSWNAFKKALLTDAKEVITINERQERKKCLASKIPHRIQMKKKIMSINVIEFIKVTKIDRDKCKRAKEKCISKKCTEIEKIEDTLCLSCFWYAL